MIDAVVVPIEDLTDFDATDEATRGCIYQYYNSTTGVFEFYVSNGTTLERVPLRPDTWLLIQKSQDQSRTSTTTLTNDSELLFSMEASKTYSIKIVVFFDTVAAADFKYALTGPSSPTLVRVRRQHLEPGGGTFTDAIDTSLTGSTSVTGGGTTGGYVMMEVLFQNGANAGTFAFQWAQDTSDAGATKVLGGSWLMYNYKDQPAP